MVSSCKRFCHPMGRLCSDYHDMASSKTNAMAEVMLKELKALSDGQPPLEKEMEYALLLLPYVFPQHLPRKGKKPSQDEAASHFIQLQSASSSMDSILENLRKKGASYPVVVALGSREDIKQSFVVVEYQAIPIAKGLVSAVDKLVKIQFIMNMNYASECMHVLHFLQRTVLEVSDDLTLCRGASDLTLYLRNKRK